MDTSDTRIGRFVHWVEKTEDCWHWRGGRNGTGYGTFRFSSARAIPAHRASYLLFKGDIPAGMQVLHTCDDRLCVNPEHLKLGTHAENMAEAAVRGRIVSGSDHYFSKHPKCGEERPGAKLTDALVVELRQRYAAGEMPSALAHEQNIHVNTMIAMLKRRTWRHIP